MNLLHDPDQSDVADAVRTMLHRLATDVRVDPPPWDELIERHRPVVVPMRSAHPVDDRDRRIRLRHRPRTRLAAALVAAVVGGALLVDRNGTEAPSGELITAVSPGEASFDARAAVPVWTSEIDDPVAATAAYLQAMGVPIDASAPSLALRASDASTATVDWSPSGRATAGGGTVYLRASSTQTTHQDWTVVGAAAEGAALEDVQFDGGNVSFTVARTSTSGELAVAAWIDGRPVPVGGTAGTSPEIDDVPIGELVDMGDGVAARKVLELPAEADDIVTLCVLHLVEGQVQSVTQMAMAMPEADPGALAGALAGATGSAEASGAGDVATDGVSGSGDAEGGVTLPDVTVALPDVTVPTVPTAPTVPTVPTIPGAPTLPLPPLPTSLPSSPTDLLP